MPIIYPIYRDRLAGGNVNAIRFNHIVINHHYAGVKVNLRHRSRGHRESVGDSKSGNGHHPGGAHRTGDVKGQIRTIHIIHAKKHDPEVGAQRTGGREVIGRTQAVKALRNGGIGSREICLPRIGAQQPLP
jgi:hypothetical protein